jgi:hypothetical protein
MKAIEWFPIGAKWYYPIYDMFIGGGYTVYEAIGDTIINDKPAKIVEQTYVHLYDGHQVRHYFTEDAGKVFYYKDGIHTLLYDFTLGVGDTFTILKSNSDFSICDTMQYVIDSVKYEPEYNNQRTQYIHYTKFGCEHQLPTYPNNEINIEYIGNTTSLFYELPLIMDASPPQYLRCYSDNTVSLRFFIQPDVSCDTIITRINNREIQSGIKIFPNPVTDIFKIDISKANLKIKSVEVVDILGNRIYRTVIIPPILSIDLSAYTKGMYIVKIGFEDTYQTFKIIKS